MRGRCNICLTVQNTLPGSHAAVDSAARGGCRSGPQQESPFAAIYGIARVDSLGFCLSIPGESSRISRLHKISFPQPQLIGLHFRPVVLRGSRNVCRQQLPCSATRPSSAPAVRRLRICLGRPAGAPFRNIHRGGVPSQPRHAGLWCFCKSGHPRTFRPYAHSPG